MAPSTIAADHGKSGTSQCATTATAGGGHADSDEHQGR